MALTFVLYMMIQSPAVAVIAMSDHTTKAKCEKAGTLIDERFNTKFVPNKVRWFCTEK